MKRYFLWHTGAPCDVTGTYCISIFSGSTGLRLLCRLALLQPATEEEREEDPEVHRGHRAAWQFPSGFTTWLPVTLTSQTTSCGATNTGRRLTDWPLRAKVGRHKSAYCWMYFHMGANTLLNIYCHHRKFISLTSGYMMINMTGMQSMPCTCDSYMW